MKRYMVSMTDATTGATSEIDTIYAREGYTAVDYIADCEENADEDWCDMLRNAETVKITQIEF